MHVKKSSLLLSCITLTISNCTRHQHYMQKTEAAKILNIGQGDQQKNIKLKIQNGKETPSVLCDLLMLFESFSKKEIPIDKTTFEQQFLPDFIACTNFVYQIFHFTFMGNKDNYYDKNNGYQIDCFRHTVLQGEFLSPYCSGLRIFQDSVNRIFEEIKRYHANYLKPGRALSATETTWKCCAFKNFSIFSKKIQCQNDNNKKQWDEILLSPYPDKNGFEFLLYLQNSAIENPVALAWQQEGDNHLISPILLSAMGETKDSLLNEVYNTTLLWTPNGIKIKPSLVVYPNGEIENRPGIILCLIEPAYIQLALYDGKNLGLDCAFPIGKSILDTLHTSLFSSTTKKPSHHKCVNNVFILLPETTDQMFDDLSKIINIEIDPENSFYKFLSDYFLLSNLNTDEEVNTEDIEQENTDEEVNTEDIEQEIATLSKIVPEEATKNRKMVVSKAVSRKFQKRNKVVYKKPIQGSNNYALQPSISKKVRQQEAANRIEYKKQQRSKETIEALKTKASLKFPELIKLCNALKRLNPESMQASRQRGSHITIPMQTKKKSITLVKKKQYPQKQVWKAFQNPAP